MLANKKIILSLIVATCFLESGCSFMAFPNDQPVIEKKLNSQFGEPGKIGTMSLTPDRRIALVNFENGRYCAEGPTEVGRDSSKIGEMKGTFKDATGNDAGLAALIAATGLYNSLNPRSQGLQLYMSASFFQCQMYMNEAIDKERLEKLQLATLNASMELIKAEIPKLADREQQIKNVGDIYKSLESAKKVLTPTSTPPAKPVAPDAPKDPAAIDSPVAP